VRFVTRLEWALLYHAGTLRSDLGYNSFTAFPLDEPREPLYTPACNILNPNGCVNNKLALAGAMMRTLAARQYRMIYDIYVLLDDGDRRILRTFNLNTSQFSVLMLLDAEHGWRLTDLSERLLFDKSTVTRIIDRLEQMGLVRRIADPSDRRVQRVLLTPSGVSLCEHAHAAHERSLEQRLAVLDPEEQHCLQALLGKLRDGLQSGLHDPILDKP
jgi:DNA-binding MarR family transcriptional regulator